MDRRSQPRIKADVIAVLSVLGAERLEKKRVCITNMSDEGFALMIDEPVGIDAAVAVEYGGILFLAEVCYCIPAQRGYKVGVRIDQALAKGDLECSSRRVVIELRQLVSA